MRKFKKNRQALNHLAASVSFMATMVVISVIVNLLAGTSAASLTTEKITISNVNFSFGDTITILAENSGTASIAIKETLVDDEPTLFRTEPEGNINPGEQVNILMKYDYSNGTSYQVKIISGKGTVQAINTKSP